MRKLRFRFNKTLDKVMAQEFLKIQGGGINFGEEIISTHPSFKIIKSLSSAEAKKFISSYFDNYYRGHYTAMNCKRITIRNSWRDREQKFITTTEKIFGGFPFPEGRYIAFMSIINCNPRFLETKTFQLYYKKSIPDALATIAHELLHFIFFDFVEENLKSKINLPEDQLWDLSEIFNVVILKLSAYSSIIDQRFVVPYPAHHRYIPKFQKAYQNSRNLIEFIQQGSKIIEIKK